MLNAPHHTDSPMGEKYSSLFSCTNQIYHVEPKMSNYFLCEVGAAILDNLFWYCEDGRRPLDEAGC